MCNCRVTEKINGFSLAYIGCVFCTAIFFVVFVVFDDTWKRKLESTFREPQQRLMNQENVQNLKRVLCVTYQGRLGNNMFQFAAAFGIAKWKKMTLIIPRNNPLLNIFNISALPLRMLGLPENYCSKIPPLEDHWHSSYDPTLIANLKNDSDIHLRGFFQSWKYWRAYEGELRQLLKFKPHIMAKVKERLNNIQQYIKNSTVLVGIHIRRGDYATSGLKVGLTTATENYFKNAIHYYRKKIQDVIFLVVSDDIKWCKIALKTEDRLYFMEGNSPIVDMAIMSVTNYTITSVGTYSFWCGWLANGTNIYYQNIFAPGSGHSRNFRNNSTSDYIYPGWIPML